MEPIKEFLKEFQPEIGKYRNEVTSFGAGHSLFNFIPGYWLFETDLNSLLDIYESPFGLKSRAELPLELRIPFDELAIISHLSLVFKDEISNRNYFIGSLFRGGKAQNENPYPAMRFNLFLSQHLRTAGNSVVPKFLNDHKDYDMLVITPSLNEIEIECKTQGNESFTLPNNLLEEIHFIKNMCDNFRELNEHNRQNTIELNVVDKPILEQVIYYLQLVLDTNSDSINIFNECIKNMPSEELYQILYIVEYLEIPKLLDKISDVIAEKIKNAIGAEIKVQTQLTSTENEKIHKLYPWAF